MLIQSNEHSLSCFQEPANAGLRLLGESDSTASQPPKPVCDWSVGPAMGEVKNEFIGNFFHTARDSRSII
jgi:hypothetical protein